MTEQEKGVLLIQMTA